MSLKNNKSLGQHWLTDRTILDAIADLAIPDTAPNPDIAVEIGPGLGTLTSSLLRRFNKVIAIEYDPRLAKNLPSSFPGKNLEVINQDFLQFDLSSLKDPYVAVGNIPYYITSPIIAKLLAAKPQPDRIVLLIQKEVAERIVAGPGKHTFLSLSVQSKAEAALGFLVPRKYFTPPPKVDSAVIVLTPHRTPLLSEKALKLAKLGFSSPRKKLIKNLPYDRSILEPLFTELGIPETARPSDLDHATWQKLKNRLDGFNH